MGITGGADQLFFSRQIGIDPMTGQEVPINGVAKVAGMLGGFELGAMDRARFIPASKGTNL